MKKFAKTIAVCAATIMALSLAACGPEDEPDKTRGFDFDGIESEVVADAAAWEAAFDFDNVTNATYTTSTDAKYKDQIYVEYCIFKFDGSKVYVKTSGEGEIANMEYYFDTENGYMYSINPETSEWSKEKVNMSEYPTTLSKVMMIETSQGVGNLKNQFDDFIYDSDIKAYKNIDAEAAGITAIVKILNGKFCGAEQKGPHPAPDPGPDSKMNVRIGLYDFGTTSVTLPKA